MNKYSTFAAAKTNSKSDIAKNPLQERSVTKGAKPLKHQPRKTDER